MLGKIIALLIVLFVFYVAWRQYQNCVTGDGGLFDKICHFLR